MCLFLEEGCGKKEVKKFTVYKKGQLMHFSSGFPRTKDATLFYYIYTIYIIYKKIHLQFCCLKAHSCMYVCVCVCICSYTYTYSCFNIHNILERKAEKVWFYHFYNKVLGFKDIQQTSSDFWLLTQKSFLYSCYSKCDLQGSSINITWKPVWNADCRL